MATVEPTQDEIVALALGRIFRMGARPSKPGDVEEYERCRALIMEAVEPSDPGRERPR